MIKPKEEEEEEEEAAAEEATPAAEGGAAEEESEWNISTTALTSKEVAAKGSEGPARLWAEAADCFASWSHLKCSHTSISFYLKLLVDITPYNFQTQSIMIFSIHSTFIFIIK